MGKKRKLTKQQRHYRQYKQELAAMERRKALDNAIEEHLFQMGDLVKVNGEVGVVCGYTGDLFDFDYSIKEKEFTTFTLGWLEYFAEVIAENKLEVPLTPEVYGVCSNAARMVYTYWDNYDKEGAMLVSSIPSAFYRNEETGEIGVHCDFVMGRSLTKEFVIVSPKTQEDNNNINNLMRQVSEMSNLYEDCESIIEDEHGLKELIAEPVGGEEVGVGSWGEVLAQMVALRKKKSKNTGLYLVNIAGEGMLAQKGTKQVVAPCNIQKYC